MQRRSRNDTGHSHGNIRLGTLNTSTLRDKLEEVVELMMEKNLDIIGIYETRLAGEGTKKRHNDFRLIHKGMNNEHKYGVAFILTQIFAERVEKNDYVSERRTHAPVEPGLELTSCGLFVWAPGTS